MGCVAFAGFVAAGLASIHAAKAGPGGFTADLTVDSITFVSGGAPGTRKYQVTVRNVGNDSARQTRIAFAPSGGTTFNGTPTVVSSNPPGLSGTCSTLFADGSGSGHCDLNAYLDGSVTIQFVVNATGTQTISAQVFSDSPDGHVTSLMSNNYKEVTGI